MKKVKMAGMALAALVLGLTGSAAWADGAGKSDKAKEAPKQALEAPADVLTHKSLKEKLENLGYELKVVQSKSGSPMYLLDFVRDNYRYVFYASLSTDKARLWLSSALRPLPAGKDLRPDILEKILARNDDIGPTHFTLRSNRYLYLELGLANHGITSARLRKEIDDFAGNIRSSEHLWNPAKYPKLEAPKAK